MAFEVVDSFFGVAGLTCGMKQAGFKVVAGFDNDKTCEYAYSVDGIERAINDNKQISFKYFDYDEKHNKLYRKNGKRYYANPIIMVWNKDNYYMLCFNNGHDEIVT